MTYCVAMRLNAGLVFLSDSRTNAGLDQISTFRKMTIYEREGDRVLVMLSAGNLAITQAVKQVLGSEAIEGPQGEAITIWNAKSMFVWRASWAAPCARCTPGTPTRSKSTASTSTAT
jgi:putative proteasome-type protease